MSRLRRCPVRATMTIVVGQRKIAVRGALMGCKRSLNVRLVRVIVEVVAATESWRWLIPFVSILVGILTGVIANLATYFFTAVCLPAYREYVYRGTRVDGNWTITHLDDPEDDRGLTVTWDLSASLKQKAYAVSGTAVARCTGESGSGDIINYVVGGTINDGFLSLTFSNSDQSRVAHSAFLIKVSGDASTLRGYRLFYGLRLETIRSVECLWSRGVHGLGGCKTRQGSGSQDAVEVGASADE